MPEAKFSYNIKNKKQLDNNLLKSRIVNIELLSSAQHIQKCLCKINQII